MVAAARIVYDGAVLEPGWLRIVDGVIVDVELRPDLGGALGELGQPGVAGVQTFSVRQSSLMGRGPTPGSPLAGGWGHSAPTLPASCGPSQGSAGCGGICEQGGK